MEDLDIHAACPECTAGCNYEAMYMCRLPADLCPILKRPPERFNGPNGAFEFLPAPGGDPCYVRLEDAEIDNQPRNQDGSRHEAKEEKETLDAVA